MAICEDKRKNSYQQRKTLRNVNLIQSTDTVISNTLSCFPSGPKLHLEFVSQRNSTWQIEDR